VPQPDIFLNLVPLSDVFHVAVDLFRGGIVIRPLRVGLEAIRVVMGGNIALTARIPITTVNVKINNSSGL
jgi:hypothetical protein